MSEIDRTHDAGRSGRLGVGWLAFTAALLVTMGIFRILDAFWAFRYDDDIPEGLQTIIFDSNLAAWGWIWLLLGTLMILAGFAVVQGLQWARWFGIAVLAVAAITNYT